MFLRGEDAGLGVGQGCVWVCTHSRACRDGVSPVDIASSEGHSDCVAALVRAGAPPPSDYEDGASFSSSSFHEDDD